MLLLTIALSSQATAFQPFEIALREAGTGAPAGCVTLRTVDHATWTSDANGTVAIVAPGLVGRDVWFYVDGPGWGVAPDFFGFRGFVAHVTEGGRVQVALDPAGPPPPCTTTFATDLVAAFPAPAEMHRISVIDADTGRGVPLVELDHPLGRGPMLTDSAGNVAIYEPDLLGTTVDLPIRSHGYHHAVGLETVSLTPGATTVIEVTRDQVAERLYRLTGSGVYRDTVLLDLPAPIAKPTLNAGVMGQDSALALRVGGRILWIWGDTNLPAYPLGIFQATGAWSDLPVSGGLTPDVGVDFSYVVDPSDTARAMAPAGAGATWLTSLSSVDDGGTDAIVAISGVYEGLAIQSAGVVRFDEAAEVFVAEAPIPLGAPMLSTNHLVPWTVGGERWLFDRLGLRVRATLDAFADPAAWEGWSPTASAWVPGDAAPDAAWTDRAVEPDTGESVLIHNGSAAFNAHRRRFFHVFTQNGGAESFLGEIWLSEADTPIGPWVFARRIATHRDYTFYNPLVQPFFDQDGGRTVYVQGTFSEFFSGTPEIAPRYDYNQQLLRLDLDDPRLILPVPVYDVAGDGTDLRTAPALRDGDPTPVAFHAPDRLGDGLLGVWWEGPDCGTRTLEVGADPPGELLFAVRADTATGTVPLFRATGPDGGIALTLGDPPAGFTLDAAPVGWVWANPIQGAAPVADHLPPRVDAGPDRCLVDDGAPIPFDGLASRDLSDGTWTWSVDGAEIASGQQAALPLAPGDHRITLCWSDGDLALCDEVQARITASEADPDPEQPGGTPGDPASPVRAGDDGCGCVHSPPNAPLAFAWVPILVAIPRFARRRARNAPHPRR